MAPRKLSRHYQTFALVFLNTLVLTAVVLLALHLIFPLEQSIWHQNLDGRRLSEDLVPEHYYFTDGEETDRIRGAFDDYVLAGHWQVHPWTGLISRTFASEYLNVDESGRRASAAPSPAHAGRPPLVLWAYGGSTLFGWGVSDRTTVPSQLQAALQQRFPDRQVRVLNFGVPWYNSAHEVALLLASLRREPEPPDAVLFLDGLNDLVHRLHYHTESPLHPQLHQAWEDRLDAMFAPPPWIRLAPSLPLFRAAQALGYPTTPSLGGLYGSDDRDREALIRQAADDYGTNRRVATAICEKLKTTPTFFLQPVPMWLDEARSETVDPDYEAFSRQVLGQGDARLHDLRAALAALEPTYAMTVEENGAHYSDAAGRVLAEAMAEVMAEVITGAPAGEIP